MSLVNELIKGLLPEEEGKKTIGVFGGGFKPPHKGHFEVLKTALDENPEIDEMLVFIGKGERDGITQEESYKIWEIYGKYLPFKVKYIKSTKPPIQLIYNTAKENPESEVLWVIGAREANDQDFTDISSRTKGITKYSNLELRTIVTKGGTSGTAARNAAKVSKEKLDEFLPSFLSKKEKQDIFVLLSNSIMENASYSQTIDIKKEIAKLTKYMLDQGKNITPLPKLIFKNGDSANAQEFLGKTAYYDPDSMSIVLYTEGRHPKDIVRSFSHEIEHHVQNIEGRLGNITTTNTQEDDHLNKLEQEANLKGTMTFRNWTDGLNENLNDGLYPFKVIDKTYGDGDNSLITVEYEFITPTNPYRVEFYSGEYNPESKTFDLSFGVHNGDFNSLDTFQMTGEGNARKIFKTLLTIVEDFIDKEEVEKIVINGTDLKRKRIYKTLFQSSPSKISDKIELNELNTQEIKYWALYANIFDYLNNKDYEQKYQKLLPKLKGEQLNALNYFYEEYFLKDSPLLKVNTSEAIVGDKIECDNCDWSWDIVSGGDDLFLCHKCGYDNTPLNENILPQEKFAQETGKDWARESLRVLVLKNYDLENYVIKTLPLESIKPTQFGEDYINASSEYEAKVYDRYLKGEIEARDVRKEDFYPIVVDKGTMKILDGNHRHAVHKMLGIPKIKAILISKKINENKNKDPFGINAYAMELGRLREEEKDYKIYVDMDGVVADFDQRFKDLSGISPREFEEKYGKNAFWDFIDEGENKLKFWVGIPQMSDAKQLIDYVSKYDYEMLTAPSLKKQSLMGKGLWVKNQTNKGLFPSKPKVNYKSAKNKKDFAAPNHILIDDREDTINSWNTAGGIGILHTSAANTISQLKKLSL